MENLLEIYIFVTIEDKEDTEIKQRIKKWREKKELNSGRIDEPLVLMVAESSGRTSTTLA